MRRLMICAGLAAPLLLTAACGTMDGRETGHASTMARLEADCSARSGILQPTGAQTGRPETDNACVIRGGDIRRPGS